MDKEFNLRTYDVLGTDHWSSLKNSPIKVKILSVYWENRLFETPSGKYEFYSEMAEEAGNPALPTYYRLFQPKEK